MAKGVKVAYAAHRLSALTAVPFSSRNRCRLDYHFKDLPSIDKLGGTDLKLLPPPRLVLNFPNEIIKISGMYSTTIFGLEDIPDPLTIGGSCKDVEDKDNKSLDLSKHRAGTSEHPLFCIYLFIYCWNFRLSLAVSSHRRRRRRRPMTTIPTRLARAAAVSTSSVQQRKRVLDLYREWIRGVRSLFFFLRLPALTFLPSCHFPHYPQ
jgi:hypothetical protein